MNLPNESLTVGQMPDDIFQSLLQKVVQIEKIAKSADLSSPLDSADANSQEVNSSTRQQISQLYSSKSAELAPSPDSVDVERQEATLSGHFSIDTFTNPDYFPFDDGESTLLLDLSIRVIPVRVEWKG